LRLPKLNSLLALLTLEGTIFEVNEAALGAAGGKREEVIGRKFWEPWWNTAAGRGCQT